MLTTTAVTTLPSPACKTIYCTQCNRKFGNTKDLQNHIQDSLSHRAAASSLNCEICKKAFKSEKALQQHTRSSPRSHSSLFNCRICDRSFNSEEMLQQHIRDSQAHAASFDCVLCNREFNSNEALQQHLLNSVTHHRRQQQPRTPLDQFFLSFTTFDHDPSEPPAACFNRLRRHQGWRRGDADSNDAWDRYQAALESELRMWYDSGNSLAAWHALCRAIGVDPLPQTCEMCERVSDVCRNLTKRKKEKKENSSARVGFMLKFLLGKITGRAKHLCQYCRLDRMGTGAAWARRAAGPNFCKLGGSAILHY